MGLALAGGWTADARCADEPSSGGKELKSLGTATQDSGLIVEVLEIKRDEHEQLYIRWRYRNPTDRPIELVGKSPPVGRGPKTAFMENTYYESGKLETANSYRIPIVSTVRGNNWRAKVLPRSAVVVGPKKDYEFWACFYLPRGNDSKITLHIADTPPIEGLEVPKKSDK
jgi:hypothetical protein